MTDNAPQLYYTDLSGFTENFDTLLPLLSQERRQIVSRRPPKSRLTSAFAELLLRYALRDNGYDPSISVLWDGKPRFADVSLPLRFNLSHSGSGVALLLSFDGTPVGVDTEDGRLPKNADAIARRGFTAEEYARFCDSPDQKQEFFTLWTAKEAFLKYTGEGFSRPMRSVTTSLPLHSVWTIDDGVRITCRIYRYFVGNAILCAATDAISPPILRQIPIEIPIFFAAKKAENR